jgi:hypothetical protein
MRQAPGVAGMKLKELLLVLAIAGVASCDSTEAPMAPAALQPSHAVVSGSDGKEYTLVEGQLPYSMPTASAWIGKDGGWVYLWGGYKDGRATVHAINVPEGAVTKPTLFSINIASDQYVQVDLRAQVLDNKGSLKDVGKNGFRKPVYLLLTYAWATNVTDASKLTILYDPENGNTHQKIGGEVLFGLDKYVVVELSHFSKYAMALD